MSTHVLFNTLLNALQDMYKSAEDRLLTIPALCNKIINVDTIISFSNGSIHVHITFIITILKLKYQNFYYNLTTWHIFTALQLGYLHSTNSKHC